MTQSEAINELATALSKAQGEMQSAIKDKVNPFFKSSYADLGSVWDAARPVLSKYGLCVMQTTELLGNSEQIVMVTTLAHTSGQWMKSFLPLKPAKNDSQGIGAAITYLRRYSLSAIVGVVCDDDDDGEEAVGRGKKESPPVIENLSNNPLTKEEVETLNSLLKNLDEDGKQSFLGWIKKTYNAQTIQDLSRSAFQQCTLSLQTKIKYINDKKKQQGTS